MPHPFLDFVIATTLDDAGRASVNVPLPGGSASVSGLDVLARWLSAPAGSAACSAIAFDLTDCIRIRIE